MNTLKHLLAVLVLLVSTYASAYTDSLAYLSPSDSVMLEIDLDGYTKFTTHTFKPKQTVYSLSRFYAQDIDQVYELNPILIEKEAQIGQTIRIAVPNKTITRYRTPGFDSSDYVPVTYTIRPGETMFNLATRIFRMPVDTFKRINGLESDLLKPGQIVQVGWMSLKGSADKIKTKALSELERTSRLAEHREAVKVTERPVKRGVASWNPGSGEVRGSLFAMYNGVPPSSYVKVTNLTNNQHVYVRVIGSLPTNTRSDKVDILLSGTAARVLGASNKNFYVTIQ